jgi:hypothetical protein
VMTFNPRNAPTVPAGSRTAIKDLRPSGQNCLQ